MKTIREITDSAGIKDVLNLGYCPFKIGKKNKVNILALGDVGMTMLIGLKLLGNDFISEIGICDIRENNATRLEMEMNQLCIPFEGNKFPDVKVIDENFLFDCDVMVFCASKGVPALDARGDVRMAQLEANKTLVAHYARLAAKKKYKGLIAVVSDPVDPLCNVMLEESGLHPAQVRGFGLGVMNARANYFAEKNAHLSDYLTSGRAFGPHGEDLVIANNIFDYNDELSKELTRLTVRANVKVRELGYKPYIAPALSSAALSVLTLLQGKWHYSSIYFGSDTEGAFLGIKNKQTEDGIVYENIEVCDELFARIEKAYLNLCHLK